MAKKHKEYTINDWKGITKYNCGYCYFDSFDEEEIKKHVQDHKPKPPREKQAIPMKDRFGNTIVDKFGNQLYKYV